MKTDIFFEEIKNRTIIYFIKIIDGILGEKTARIKNYLKVTAFIHFCNLSLI